MSYTKDELNEIIISECDHEKCEICGGDATAGEHDGRYMCIECVDAVDEIYVDCDIDYIYECQNCKKSSSDPYFVKCCEGYPVYAKEKQYLTPIYVVGDGEQWSFDEFDDDVLDQWVIEISGAEIKRLEDDGDYPNQLNNYFERRRLLEKIIYTKEMKLKDIAREEVMYQYMDLESDTTIPQFVKDEMIRIRDSIQVKELSTTRKMVIATYTHSEKFKIPEGVDLDDKTQVEDWYVKWNILNITYVDGREEEIEAEGWVEQHDYKHPKDAVIEIDHSKE